MRHLNSEEFAAYMDGHMDKNAERHLLECRSCRANLSDLVKVAKDVNNSEIMPSDKWYSSAYSNLGVKSMKLSRILSLGTVAAAILFTIFLGIVTSNSPQVNQNPIATPGFPVDRLAGPKLEPVTYPQPVKMYDISASAPTTITGPDITQIVKSTDKITVYVGLRKSASGTLKVSLDNDTRSVDIKSESKAVHSFTFNNYKQSKVKVSLGQEEWEEDLGALEITDQEMSIFTGERFMPASQATLRVLVYGISSISYVHLRNVDVEISLKDKKLYHGRTDETGTAVAIFSIPDLVDGDYDLVVKAASQFKTNYQTMPIKVKSEYKILLLTDKPLYQPGQEINLRALVLNQFDLKPLSKKEILFEIEDAKANKVFKKRVNTSEFGIASCKFQLADEVAMGEYKISAVIDKIKTEKTVTVKRYVLPTFEITTDVDKKFYMPKETIKGTIAAKYTFGKPVTKGKVVIEASTFDVEFKKFATVTPSITNEHGKSEFEIQLPDYFVGQPLDKGSAMVKLDISVTDTADHVEKKTITYPVVNQPIKLTVVPESGRIVPDVENIVYILAVYPDGTPAEVDLVIKGRQVNLKEKTDKKSGFKTVTIIPKKGDFRQGQHIYNSGIFTHGRIWYPEEHYTMYVYDLEVTASDGKGAVSTKKFELSSDPTRDNLLLRLDKAVYKGSDSIKMDIFTAGSGGTVYIDIIKNRQTILTHSVDVESGKAKYNWTIPQDIFGTLEIHAYQLTSRSGVFIRDSRVIYVHPASELKIKVTPEIDQYRPRNSSDKNPFGADTFIKFQVTDSRGNPVKSAIGVIIVDTAVYALQEMQPGLEKVYFTLEQELANPKYELKDTPFTLPEVLKEKEDLEVMKQDVAKALLAGVEPFTQFPGAPTGKDQNFSNNLWNVYWQIQHQITGSQGNLKFDTKGSRIDYTKETKDWIKSITGNVISYETVIRHMPYFKPQEAAKKIFEVRKNSIWASIIQNTSNFQFDKGTLNFQNWVKTMEVEDVAGKKWTVEELSKNDPIFTPENIANAVLNFRRDAIWTNLWCQIWNGKIKIEELILEGKIKRDTLASIKDIPEKIAFDGKGDLIQLDTVMSVEDLRKMFASKQWYTINLAMWKYISESGKYYDSKSNMYVLPLDILATLVDKNYLERGLLTDPWGQKVDYLTSKTAVYNPYYGHNMNGAITLAGQDLRFGTTDDITRSTYYSHFYYGGYYVPSRTTDGKRLRALSNKKNSEFYYPSDPGRDLLKSENKCDKEKEGGHGDGGREGKEVMPLFVREWFPETLLFEPELVTDDKGEATLKLKIADSITTWKLSASASSMNGKLGSTAADIRVFQDFFISPDLPVALTQNDEISIPIAVYNYMQTSQKIRLVFEPDGEEWFESMDDPQKIVEVGSNEVRAVYFRIKAVKIGDSQSLKVTAYGTKMSDAVKKSVRVEPNGKMFEVVKNDKLSNTSLSLEIPQNAIDGASKILFKVYPGIYTQVIEGIEGILQAPHG